jgi:hypothetical protein
MPKSFNLKNKESKDSIASPRDGITSKENWIKKVHFCNFPPN